MKVDIVEDSVSVDEISLKACSPSRLRRPPAGTVKNSQKLDFVIADAIGNYVGRARNNQFAGPGDPSRAAQCRMPLQQIDRFVNGLNHAGCGLRFVTGDVFRLGVQVRERPGQPSNAHAESTSFSSAVLLEEWRTRRDRPHPRPS